MTDVAWWSLVVLMIGAGLAGTVLPALPGTLLILGGIVLGAWIDGFARVGTVTLGVITALAVLAWVLDYVAGLLGAKKAGASRLALVGAAVGTVLGIFMGLVGVLSMPLVGAAVGEYWAQRQAQRQAQRTGAAVPTVAGAAEQKALQVGVATWLGIMVGLIAKVVIGCVMVGIFVVALIF